MKLFISILCSLIFCFCHTQEKLTLEYVLNRVINHSYKMQNIHDKYASKDIQFENYKKSFLPQVSLNINAPYQRSIQEVIQYDGSISLLERNYMNPSANFTTEQIIPFTGGKISVTNSLSMVDNLSKNETSFSSNWININYSQAINGFNKYKWQKKEYEYIRILDSINYKKEVINLKKEISQLYFDAYILQLKCSITKKNIEKTALLLSILKEKKKQDRATDLELNQVEITLNQLNQKLVTDTFDLEILLRKMYNQMNSNYEKESVILEPVQEILINIDREDLLKKIIETNFEINAQVKLLGAEADLEKTIKEGAINISLQLGIGLNSSANEINNLYNKPFQKEFVSIGAYVPLINWKILKNKKKIAGIEKEILKRDLEETRFQLEMQAEGLFNYMVSLDSQIMNSKQELKLQEDTNNLIYNLLVVERKTIYEYKNQLYEYEKSALNYNQLLINKYLLKLTFEEIFLWE